MATWPTDLPQEPIEDAFEETLPDNVLKTQMDVGPPKRRRRTLANVTPITCGLKLTATQVEALKTFYVTTSVSGTQSVQWVHPRTGVSVDMMFGSPPKFSSLGGGFYLATLQMEILP